MAISEPVHTPARCAQRIGHSLDDGDHLMRSRSNQQKFICATKFHIYEFAAAKWEGKLPAQLTTSASISAAGSTVKSALRAIEILEFFTRVRQPRAMSEIGLAL